MSADILQDKSVALNGKNDVPVVSQPITRGGLRVYKIVVLGDGGVGKSAVTLQFVSHSFLDYHDPTIEDSYQQQAVIDGEAALLDILDTAGQVEFTAMRDQYMRCGEGFMICYSVTDRHSFQEALEYRKLITRVRANEDIPLVLVGNKFDLQHQRKVTTEEGKALAEQLGCPFYETSAALRQFIDDAFYSLVRQIRAKERSRNSEHLPEGLICEEVTISMDVHNASWSALCIATDAFPTPKDAKNCIPVKRLLQMSFGKYGIVRRVQISIHNQPNGDVSYKWEVLIDPRHATPKAFGVYIQKTLQHYLESTLDQTHN